MALETEVVGIDFTGGLETRADERLVVPGKYSTLQNATLTKTGALIRRDGWSPLCTIAAANGLATFNSELLAINGPTLYSVSNTTSTAYSRGTIPSLTVSKTEIQRGTGLQDQHDLAYAGLLTCYVWRDKTASGGTNGLKYSVLDEGTGTQIVSGAALTSSTEGSPRVVATANAFIILYVSGNNIKARVVQFASPTVLGAETTLRTDLSNSGQLDACLFNGNVLVAYKSNDATYAVQSIGVTQAAGVPSVAVGPFGTMTAAQLGSALNIRGITCAAFSASRAGVFVLVQTGAAAGQKGLWGATITSGYASAGAAAQLDATAAPADSPSRVTAVLAGSNLQVFSDDAGDYNIANGVLKNIRTTTVNSSNVIQSGPSTFASSAMFMSGGVAEGENGPLIAAKAFAINSAVYLPVFVSKTYSTTSALQQTLFLLDSSANVVAKALPSTYGANSTTGGAPNADCTPSVWANNSNTVIMPAGEQALLSLSSGQNVSATGLCKLQFSATNYLTTVPPIKAQVGQNLFLSGGALTAYDGVAPTEAGFHLFPEGLKVTDGAAGSVDAGVHQYVALYEWIDGAGQRHQSAPSVAVSYTAPSVTVRAQVAIPTLLLTSKPNVNIVVYRTKAAGTSFFRLNAVSAPLANDKTVAYVTYTDNATDASLSGELLYTNGGALPNNGPPSCTVLGAHQDRVWTDVADDQGAFRFSQPVVTGFGIQWNEALGGRLPASAGAVAGFASIDDKQIIFANKRIFAVFGQGPNSTGLQGTYTLPTEIASDVGCSEPRSILKMPHGIIFKSAKGWHLLDRKLGVSYIGSAVEAFNGNDVSSAVLLDDRKECRLSSLTGTTLVYSYLVDQWSVFTNYAAADAVEWSSVYVHCTTAGSINKDTPATYSDNGSAIVITAATAWLRPGSKLHGFQRMRRMLLAGAYGSSSSLVISAGYDYASTYSQALTVNPTSALANSDGNAWQLRWHLPQQKCEAVRFKFVETPSGGSLAGLSFASMSLEVAIKRGAAKLPAAQSQ